MLSDKAYNVLKWVAMIALPAVGTLYFTVAAIWNLPNADKILGTIVAANAFLGTLIGVSTYNYNQRNVR